MSSGGHFKSYWVSRKRPKYFPSLTPRGTTVLSPFLVDSGLPESDKSRDPLLVTKILTEKKVGTAHESDRFIHTRQVTFIKSFDIKNSVK